MTSQPSLFRAKAPKVSDQDVQWMLRALDGRGWVTAKQLKDFAPDRWLRAIASASQGRIVSGQRGYAVTSQASVEDATHAADWLAHQGIAMIRRSKEIRAVVNGRLQRSA